MSPVCFLCVVTTKCTSPTRSLFGNTKKFKGGRALPYFMGTRPLVVLIRRKMSLIRRAFSGFSWRRPRRLVRRQRHRHCQNLEARHMGMPHGSYARTTAPKGSSCASSGCRSGPRGGEIAVPWASSFWPHKFPFSLRMLVGGWVGGSAGAAFSNAGASLNSSPIPVRQKTQFQGKLRWRRLCSC